MISYIYLIVILFLDLLLMDHLKQPLESIFAWEKKSINMNTVSLKNIQHFFPAHFFTPLQYIIYKLIVICVILEKNKPLPSKKKGKASFLAFRILLDMVMIACEAGSSKHVFQFAITVAVCVIPICMVIVQISVVMEI